MTHSEVINCPACGGEAKKKIYFYTGHTIEEIDCFECDFYTKSK